MWLFSSTAGATFISDDLVSIVMFGLKSAAATLAVGFSQRPTLESSWGMRPLPMAACAQKASHACAAEPAERLIWEDLRGLSSSNAWKLRECSWALKRFSSPPPRWDFGEQQWTRLVWFQIFPWSLKKFPRALSQISNHTSPKGDVCTKTCCLLTLKIKWHHP